MNPQTNPPHPGAPSQGAPLKRKRGRPRKDETQAQSLDKLYTPPFNRPPPNPMVTRTQGELYAASNPTTPNIPITSKGKDHIVVNDEMVGQMVTGVLECAFDSGYFLTVRIGETDVHMRGVVFKEDSVVPVTPENDIASDAVMYKREEFPIPLKPTENIENPQIVCNSSIVQTSEPQVVVREENHSQVVNDIACNAVMFNQTENPQIVCDSSAQYSKASPEEPQFQLGLPSLNKIVQNTLPNEASIVQTSDQVVVREENSSQLINEPHFEVRKISEVDENMSYLNANVESAAVLPMQVLIQPESAFSDKEPGAMSQMLDPEMGGASGFQISMENTDNDEPFSENPSPMRVEYKEESEK